MFIQVCYYKILKVMELGVKKNNLIIYTREKQNKYF